VRLRLTGRGRDAVEAERRVAPLRDHVLERAGRWIYGHGDDTLEACVGRLLASKPATVSTAESCTGGLVSHRLTNVPGASAYVLGAVVAYHNDVKRSVLGIPAPVLERHGAVSREVALAMASGVRRLTGSDYAVATTGIMGPDGGTDAKPVGTVWIAVEGPSDNAGQRGPGSGADVPGVGLAVMLRLGTDRVRNKERAATAALDLLRKTLEGLSTDETTPVA
jgi:nicotinamide-nucleotide amidase